LVSRQAILRARWVVPVEGPAIENGVVDVGGDGRVAALGSWDVSSHRGVIDFDECVLLPGFVNAHTHLELTCYAGQIPSGSLWTWIRRLVELRSQPGQVEREREGARHGAALSLKAGVTTVGDISRMHLAWPVLKDSPLRKVCFAELLCFAAEPARTLEELDEKVRETQVDERLAIGISPHAPYSVTGEQIRGCVEMARRERLPLTMHVAETREERRLIEKGGGKLYYYLWWAGFLKKCPPPRRPLFEHLADCGLFDIPSLLAHVNYIEDRELDRLARSSCSVAYCPRAHRFHQHEPHRFREMLDRGINVCVGTDSLAGTESLSVLDELRFLHRGHPDLDTSLLLEMGTIRGARALQLEAEVGSIAAGKCADLVAIPLDPGGSCDPFVNVLESGATPVAVVIGGEPCALSGGEQRRHVAASLRDPPARPGAPTF
jgi:cytosine/adenosine deaminase-related metal-dependent hydrolase